MVEAPTELPVGVEDGVPLVGGTLTTPASAATGLLQQHMEELYAKRSQLEADIAEINARKDKFESEYHAAEERFKLIAECKVLQEIQDCQTQLEQTTKSRGAQGQVLDNLEAELKDYKDQMHNLFVKMGGTSTEMQKHCKKTQDDEEHANVLDQNLTDMQEHLRLAQEAVAKKKDRHVKKAAYDECCQLEQDLTDRLQQLLQQKNDEETEAAEIQGSFEQKKADLNGLLAHLEAMLTEKKGLDQIIEQVEAPFKRIHASSATLLDVLTREKTCLKTQPGPPISWPANDPTHLNKQ